MNCYFSYYISVWDIITYIYPIPLFACRVFETIIEELFILSIQWHVTRVQLTYSFSWFNIFRLLTSFMCRFIDTLCFFIFIFNCKFLWDFILITLFSFLFYWPIWIFKFFKNKNIIFLFFSPKFVFRIYLFIYL